jgi:putative phosphoesterase
MLKRLHLIFRKERHLFMTLKIECLRFRAEVLPVAMSLPPKGSYRLGVISDTHGYLPPRALDVFRDVDAILHAGDIGSQEILRALARIAPILAVRGNMDSGPWAKALAEKESIQAGGSFIHLIHDLLKLRMDSGSNKCLAVVNGHTHRPSVETKNGVLYVNPGSAGAPRHGEHPCVALIRVTGSGATADLICLPD